MFSSALRKNQGVIFRKNNMKYLQQSGQGKPSILTRRGIEEDIRIKQRKEIKKGKCGETTFFNVKSSPNRIYLFIFNMNTYVSI